METTTTTGREQDAVEPVDAMTERELRVEISRQRQLLGVLDTPGLLVDAAERIAACARELERRDALCCPACNSPRVYAMGHGVMACSPCGARFGNVSWRIYRSYCPGGWSADPSLENARYVDFTITEGEGEQQGKRFHGWVSKTDSTWVQIG